MVNCEIPLQLNLGINPGVNPPVCLLTTSIQNRHMHNLHSKQNHNNIHVHTHALLGVCTIHLHYRYSGMSWICSDSNQESITVYAYPISSHMQVLPICLLMAFFAVCIHSVHIHLNLFQNQEKFWPI